MTILRSGRAWLPALCAAIGCTSSPSVQVLTGRVDTSQHAVAVRAVVGDTVAAAAEVRSDGSFTLALPAGDRYRLEVLTSAGVKHLVTRDGSSLHGLTFKVCAPVEPFDIGNCGGPGGGGTTCDDPTDPSCKPPPCDPSDPACPPPPPPCDDPTDPNCKPLPCDPTTDPACPPPPGCDPGDPSCPPPWPGCDPADPSCVPCDPATDPYCPPPPCDPTTDPACPPPPGCDPGDPSCPPPWPGCDPADPSCVPCDPTTDPYCKCDANGNCGGGGGTGGGCTDPTEPGCAPPCSDPTDPDTCKDPCVADPMSCGCGAGEPNCWPQPPKCDANGTCDPGSSMAPDHPPGDFGCTGFFPS